MAGIREMPVQISSSCQHHWIDSAFSYYNDKIWSSNKKVIVQGARIFFPHACIFVGLPHILHQLPMTEKLLKIPTRGFSTRGPKIRFFGILIPATTHGS